MVRFGFTIMALMSFSSIAGAFDIKGVTLGMQETSIPEALGMKCANSAKGRACAAKNVPFGNTTAMLGVTIYLSEVDSILVNFPQRDYKDIVEALHVKYGAPIENVSGLVSNLLGATFGSRETVWQVGHELLIANERDKIDQSSIFLISIPRLKASEERSRERAAETAKRL